MFLSVLSDSLIVLYHILNVYFYYMIFVALLSWIPGVFNTSWYYKLRKISDFYMGRFRGWIVIGNIDFTTIIGFLIYEFALQMFSLIPTTDLFREKNKKYVL